ncbi:uncharacterized protein [Diabrotica undecimpunctata]|uniref:uncharacterized protein n=1 Tax=Diabrotica undecimpunctata TaxID=50387 RepID=UPI003B63AC7A
MNASNTNTFNTQNHSLPAPKHAEIQQSMGEIHPTSSYQYVQANSGSYRPPQQISSLPNSTQDQNVTSTGVTQQPHQAHKESPYLQLQPLTQLLLNNCQYQQIKINKITKINPLQLKQTKHNLVHTKKNAQIRPSQHQLNSQRDTTYTQQNIGQYLHNPNSPPQPQAPRVMQPQTPVLNTVQGNIPANTAGQVGYQLKQHEQIQPKYAGDYLAQPHSNPSFQGNTAGQVAYQLKQHEQIQPKQAGDYLVQPHSNPSFHGNITNQTKTTKSAAELFKTNAFQPTSISKLAKRHLNKITQPTECDLIYGYPPQRNESAILNAPIPSIRQRS